MEFSHIDSMDDDIPSKSQALMAQHSHDHIADEVKDTPFQSKNHVRLSADLSLINRKDPGLASMALSRPIFLASLGNPAPYANTLHSAGHILLGALATHLNLPPLTSNPTLRPGLSTSQPETHLTLWQSPVQMNISGKPLAQAWKSYLSHLPAESRSAAKLYVLHDELEAQLGKIKIRHTGSPKGHNGLKSVISAFAGRQDGFSRVGIGIGRPESRAPEDVSRYVLRTCRANEVAAIRDAAAEVVRLLEIG